MKLDTLKTVNRVLFGIPLSPLQGDRFQPTGFPNLGAATYQTARGACLLVESAQSMANRMETVCWDEAAQQPVPPLAGISYVRVERKGRFLTSSLLEAHRINSPYMLEGSDKKFFNELKKSLGGLVEGPINRKLLAETLFKYDAGALLHGVFLAKKDLAGGRLRIARAISAFVEAEGVQVAASGGVKNDHVNPSGDTKSGFGNVPFSRDEYTAAKITLYVNIDLTQIRGYGLDAAATHLLTILAFYKVRALLSGSLRFRTACDLKVATESVVADQPAGFALSTLAELEIEVKKAIASCGEALVQTTVCFNDEMKKSKDSDEPDEAPAETANE